MLRHSKPVILSLIVIFTVSIALLQEQTFESVSFRDGNAIKSSQARSVRTCVESCLNHCECRFVRFTKSSKGCQLFTDVLLYYGSNSTPSSSDVVDFKKLGIPLPRYQAVYVDIDQTSYDHAQSICENFGSGLATVLDQLDFEALNTTLKGINAQEYCGMRMFMGAKSPGNSVWSWRSGESISNDWAYWGPNDPNLNTEACMRMMLIASN